MSDASFTVAQRKQLREEQANEVRKVTAPRFQELALEADAIPLRTKAQYPVYAEARMLHLIKGIAVIEGVPTQEVIRSALQDAIDKRMRKPHERRPAKRRVTKKGS